MISGAQSGGNHQESQLPASRRYAAMACDAPLNRKISRWGRPTPTPCVRNSFTNAR